MADNILGNVHIAHKNDTKTNWTTKNPVLLKGEIGIEFDPNATDNSYVVKFKIGDGTKNWSDLDYFGGEQTLPAPDGTSIIADGITWSIAGFGLATANKFPVKRVTNDIASIEWVALPSHIADLDTMYTKLSGIEEGAQVNTVDSVNGKTGEVTLSASDVGAEPAFTKNTAFNKNFETDVDNIKVNGTAAVGTSNNVARADHVHPTDTTRAAAADLTAHTGDTNNPHNVTKAQIGLGDVGNFKAVSTVANQGLTDIEKSAARTNIGAMSVSEKGVANGVATLDANGQVPTSQLPSFVDDVLEGTAQGVTETDAGTYTATGFILKGESEACTPEDGKIYIDSVGDNATNIEFRWSGTQFASIGTNLVLGETVNTAYRGDRGKAAYDHSQTAHAPANAEENVINAITVGGTAATITNKSVEIPIASTSNVGVVKSSAADNQVTVDTATGAMTVNNLSTDKIFAGTDALILDCGNATI